MICFYSSSWPYQAVFLFFSFQFFLAQDLAQSFYHLTYISAQDWKRLRLHEVFGIIALFSIPGMTSRPQLLPQVEKVQDKDDTFHDAIEKGTLPIHYYNTEFFV